MRKVKKHPHSGKLGSERDFLKLLQEVATYRNYWEVFEDFLELSYCAIAKTTYRQNDEEADVLEARYMATVEWHEKDYIRRMPELLGLLDTGLHEGGDFLGRIAGEIGVLSSAQGQFFTPWEVSRMMAMITMDGVGKVIEEQGFFTMQEPASGAGGMILACADVVQEMGFIPEMHMMVDAIDISSNAFKMTYLQLAMKNIPANVYRGNTMSLEMFECQITPSKLIFCGRHGKRWSDHLEASRAKPKEKQQQPDIKLGQLNMFGDRA